jgi:hypothetical protein
VVGYSGTLSRKIFRTAGALSSILDVQHFADVVFRPYSVVGINGMAK